MKKAVSGFNKDLWGGVLLIIVGISVAIHSVSFSIGSLSRMGPGYFPLALGVIMTAMGLAIGVKGYLATPAERKPARPPEWKAWFLICLSLVAFVVLTEHLGLVAGTFGIVFISALADRDNSWKAAGVLAIGMVIISVVVFWWALQIQLPLVKWG